MNQNLMIGATVGYHLRLLSFVLVLGGSTCILNAQDPFSFRCSPATGPQEVGVLYSTTCTATGGSAHTFATRGSVPGGLSLKHTASTATLSGTPDSPGAYDYFIVGTSGGTVQIPVEFVGTIIAAPSITAPTSLANGTEGVSYGPVTFTATGGTGSYSWSATGLPSGLVMSSGGVFSGTPAAGSHGTYTVHVKVTDSIKGSGKTSLALIILPPPSVTASPSTLSFTYQIGGAAPALQPISVGSTPSGSSVTSSLGSGCGWLTLSPGSGTTPLTANAGVNTTGLAPASYSCTITFAASGEKSATVQASLTVTPTPTTLTAGPSTLAFIYEIGEPAPETQSISIGSTIPATGVYVTILPGSSCGWLTLNSSVGNTPFAANVGLNTSGLKPGSYPCTITFIASGATSATVQANLTVTAPTTITASPSTLSFTYQIGQSAPAPQTISVGSPNPASGVAVTSSLGSGCGWLSLSSGSGNTPFKANAGVNTAGLTAGPYSCTITFSTSGAPSVTVQASLTVTQTVITASPQTLSFTYQIGGSASGLQSISVGSTNPASGVAVTSSLGSGCGWLTLTPNGGNTPFKANAGVNTTGLTAGPYSCAITFSAAGAPSVTVQALLNVTQPTITTALSTLSFSYEIGGTAPGSQPISVSSTPSGLSVNSSLGSGCGWLTLSSGSGTSPFTANAGVNTSGLKPGPYSCTITFSASGATSATVQANLTVPLATIPTITVTPLTLSFGAYQIGNPPPAMQSFSVTSSNPTTGIAFTAQPAALGCGWLTLSSTGGTTGAATATITGSVNTAGLAANTSYSCTITVTATGVAGAQTVTATLATGNPPVITATSLPAGKAGSPYPANTALSATNGMPPYKNWAIAAGNLPTGLSLDSGTGAISGTPVTATGSPFDFSIQVSDSTGATSASQAFTIAITPPSVIVSPASLTFSYRQGDSTPPLPSDISVFGASAATTCTVTPSSDANWLNVNLPSGQTPFTISASVNATLANLAPNTPAKPTYTGQVSVTCANATPPTNTIAVSLVVAPPDPALSVTPPTLNIPAVLEGPSPQGQITVSNTGGGTLQFTTTTTGGNCVTLGTTSGSASFGQPAVLTYTVASGLPQGACLEQMTVQGPNNQTQTVPITVVVNPQAHITRLSQTGLQFTVAANDTSIRSQSFAVLNTGQGSMNWMIQSTTLSGGSNWLTVSPTSATSNAQDPAPPLVTVSVNPSQLNAGQYYGSISVMSDAANSPQTVTVLLNVVNNGTVPIASPSGLIYLGPAPAAQQITIYNSTGNPINFTSTHVTDDGQNWCSPAPTSGTIGQGQTGTVAVQANVSTLPAAVRNCTLTLAFGDGSVQTIQIASVNTAGASTPAAAPITTPLLSAVSALKPEASCAPTQLILEFISPVLRQNFTVAAGDAVSVQVQANDDCGNPLTADVGNVAVTFSGETQNIPAVSQQGGGIWTTTWVPSNGPTRSVTVTATASSGSPGNSFLVAQAVVTGTVIGQVGPTAALAASIVNSASYLNPGQASPGSFVSIFGSQLATAPASGALPLSCQLSDSQVLLGPTCLPLESVNEMQVNAVLPLGLNSDTIQHLVIQRGATQSFPVEVTITDQLPGIYTVSQDGKGQGVIVNGVTNALADASAPVTAGDVITIYCTGLGQVENPPPDGQPAPLQPLSMTPTNPTVTIGGIPSTNVSFSGLAPGFVGLYQVNAQVPAGVPTGPAVPVTITMGGITSNQATIAIQ